MADIFISSAREDRDRVELLAKALAAVGGWSVWWDREIPSGKPFNEILEAELAVARCTIVVWSNRSIRSHWVIEEAEYFYRRDILVPILIEPIDLPLGFRRIQTVDLTDWNGSPAFPEFQKLVSSVAAILGHPSTTSDNYEPWTHNTHGSNTRIKPEYRINIANIPEPKCSVLFFIGSFLLPILPVILLTIEREERELGKTSTGPWSFPASFMLYIIMIGTYIYFGIARIIIIYKRGLAKGGLTR